MKTKILIPAILTIGSIGGIVSPLVSCGQNNPEPDEDRTPLCFCDIADGELSTIQINTQILGESNLNVDIKTSKDKINWTNWFDGKSFSSNKITLNDGECLYVKNNKKTLSYCDLDNAQSGACLFVTTGALDLSGNVNSMINFGELTNNCFWRLFAFNDAIKSIDNLRLPSTELADGCYQSMFQGCSSIKTVKQDLLPATKLSNNCYKSMFDGCSSLESTPYLPATTLKDYCYESMFHSCSSLVVGRKANGQETNETIFSYPSNDEAINPALNMFGQTNKTSFIQTSAHKGFTYYVETGPTDLCFTDIKDDGIESSVGLKTSIWYGSTLGPVDFETSFDGITWKKWALDVTTESSSEVRKIPNGGHLYVRNKKSTLSNNPLKFDERDSINFVTTGKLEISGNVNSMINYDKLTDGCFTALFYQCQSISIDNLFFPSTTLIDNCYTSTFEDSGVESIPEDLLPAEQLANGCYSCLFMECDALKSIPENLLPATTLKESCYECMFEECTSLTRIPEHLLKATKLTYACYELMFSDCINLTTALALPDAPLVDYCYYNLFSGCTKLKITDSNAGNVKKIFTCPADTTPESCVEEMFYSTGGTYTDDPKAGETYYWVVQ